MATTTYAPMLPPNPLSPPPTPEGSTSTLVGDIGARVGSQGGMGVGSLADIGTAVLGGVAGPVGAALGGPDAGSMANATAAGVNAAKRVSELIQSGASGVEGGLSGAGAVQAVIQAVAQSLQAAGVVKLDHDYSTVMKMYSTALLAAQQALGSNPYTAAIASAINTAMTIYSGLESNQTAGQQAANAIFASTPFGLMDSGGGLSEIILEATAPTSHHWRTFPTELMQGQGQQQKGFTTLAKALPFVQSKEELGQLINSYKNYVQTTTGIQFDDNQLDPYKLDAIPGTGRGQGGVSTAHGFRIPAVDWGEAQTQLQNVIDQYRGVLPGDPITALYGQPGGGLTGEPASRLWRQHLGDFDQNAPVYLSQDFDQPRMRQVDEGGQMAEVGRDKLSEGFYGRGQLANIGPSIDPYIVSYGAPNYPYAQAGLPAPGQTLGQPSQYWQQLMSQPNAVPGTDQYQPGTIAITGGMRTGIGQPMGAFGGARSPMTGADTAQVDPSIVTGVAQQPQTGFVSTKKGAV